jgi:hypothetical protein
MGSMLTLPSGALPVENPPREPLVALVDCSSASCFAAMGRPRVSPSVFTLFILGTSPPYALRG